MKINWELKSALIERFGSQVEAARRLGIREAKLSYILRGHAEPSGRERDALERVLGRSLAKRLLMETKIFEIRDKATFIPVLAIKLSPTCEAERYLLARSGYGREPEIQAEYVVLFKLAGGNNMATSNPHQWGDARTMPVAHHYIIEKWDSLKTGEVVDVELILGETTSPKKSEKVEEAPDGEG